MHKITVIKMDNVTEQEANLPIHKNEKKKTMLRLAGLGSQVDRLEKGLCPMCGNKIGKFKDALSKKEFGISGLCQKCQDGVFQ